MNISGRVGIFQDLGQNSEADPLSSPRPRCRVALGAVPRRIEIELTSQRNDGAWTWRAAGARQPKGEVKADLVPDSASVGSVFKAEADGGLDGLEITAVFAPKERPERADRLELIGGGGGPLVTTRLVSKSARRGREGSDGPRKRPRDGDRRRDRDGRRDRDDQRGRGDEERRDRRKRRSDDDGGHDRRERRDRKPRRGERATDDAARGASSQRGDDRQDKAQDRRGAGRSKRDGDRGGPRQARSNDRGRAPKPPRPRTPGLKAKQVHRKAVLESLPDEQHRLAREILKGGLPGVRKSIDRMNAKAADNQLPQIKAEPLLTLAEQLAPTLKPAEWRDRADAALAGIDQIDLRDIRSVIAAAERAARTDETRALADSLRAGLTQRLEVDHRKWLDELASTIGEGRTIRALRLSSRPPKAGTPLPPDMAERLANMAAADLNPTANQQRWSTVVDSVALSPVRTQVVPIGIPEKPGDELLDTIRRLADRVPQIAALFGVEARPPRRGPRRPPPPADQARKPQTDTDHDKAPDGAQAQDTDNQPGGAQAQDTDNQPGGAQAQDTDNQPEQGEHSDDGRDYGVVVKELG